MLEKMIRYFIMLVLEKLGFVNNREIKRDEEPVREESHYQRVEPEAVDGIWREVPEEEEEKKEARTSASSASAHSASESSDSASSASDATDPDSPDPAPTDPDSPASLKDHINEFSRAASKIRHPKIREQAFHVLILAKDIIHAHENGHDKGRNYKQFENYYVPTVTSVVKNYCSIEAKGMMTSKMEKDVLSYLESCGDAFTNLYNSMFSNDILNMEVQMEAMDLIMKKDGLLH